MIKRVALFILVLSFAGTTTPMFRTATRATPKTIGVARAASRCCCPIFASLLVSGAAVKIEREVQKHVEKVVRKGIDAVFGKSKTD